MTLNGVQDGSKLNLDIMDPKKSGGDFTNLMAVSSLASN
jgi:hypothetical protein